MASKRGNGKDAVVASRNVTAAVDLASAWTTPSVKSPECMEMDETGRSGTIAWAAWEEPAKEERHGRYEGGRSGRDVSDSRSCPSSRCMRAVVLPRNWMTL